MIPGILDRYLLREWLKIFFSTALGFPLLTVLIDLTDNLDTYLARGLETQAIALAYFFSLPDKVFMVLPAAVLFATVFSLGSLSRHSELAAAKASGRSFYRMFAPVLAVAVLAAGIGLVTGELAPTATRRQVELLGEVESRSQPYRRNFVYRADEGWVYAIRALDIDQQQVRDVVLQREGGGSNYPTLAVQARRAFYRGEGAGWTLINGQFRIMRGPDEMAFSFDSLRLRGFTESPADLLVEPKRPQEMTYAELGRYIDALERSGGDGGRLTVERALKIAIPFTCVIIAIFAAPLAIAAPRAGGAFGVALSLGTTLVFLTTIRLTQTFGAAGSIPPTLAAWVPNIAFGLVGLWLLKRAPT